MGTINFIGSASSAEMIKNLIETSCRIGDSIGTTATAYDISKNILKLNDDYNKNQTIDKFNMDKAYMGVVSILAELAKRGASYATFPVTMNLNIKKINDDIAEHVRLRLQA